MASQQDLDRARRQTRAVYERQADRFDTERSRDGQEVPWLERFTRAIARGGQILDLGCGAGEPIAGWLIARGFRVTGVDYAEPMLALARARFPTATWLQADMRALELTEGFDGILSWHGSFHLDPDEQRALLPCLAAALRGGGTLMMTIGPAAGEVTGIVAGEAVYHASLDHHAYRAALEAAGMVDIEFASGDSPGGGPFVLLARRRQA